MNNKVQTIFIFIFSIILLIEAVILFTTEQRILAGFFIFLVIILIAFNIYVLSQNPAKTSSKRSKLIKLLFFISLIITSFAALFFIILYYYDMKPNILQIADLTLHARIKNDQNEIKVVAVNVHKFAMNTITYDGGIFPPLNDEFDEGLAQFLVTNGIIDDDYFEKFMKLVSKHDISTIGECVILFVAIFASTIPIKVDEKPDQSLCSYIIEKNAKLPLDTFVYPADLENKFEDVLFCYPYLLLSGNTKIVANENKMDMIVTFLKKTWGNDNNTTIDDKIEIVNAIYSNMLV